MNWAFCIDSACPDCSRQEQTEVQRGHPDQSSLEQSGHEQPHTQAVHTQIIPGKRELRRHSLGTELHMRTLPSPWKFFFPTEPDHLWRTAALDHRSHPPELSDPQGPSLLPTRPYIKPKGSTIAPQFGQPPWLLVR